MCGTLMNIKTKAPTLHRYIETFGNSFEEIHKSLVLAGSETMRAGSSPVAEVVTIEMRREILADLSEQTAGMIQAQVQANTQMTSELKRAQDKASKFQKANMKLKEENQDLQIVAKIHKQQVMEREATIKEQQSQIEALQAELDALKKANAPKKISRKKSKKGKGELSDDSDAQYTESLIPENDVKRQQMLLGHLERCCELAT